MRAQKSTRKRTCNRCRALQFNQGEEAICMLQYKLRDGRFDPKPPSDINCPKPLTYSDFVDLHRHLWEE